jgi:hypothetical protein
MKHDECAALRQWDSKCHPDFIDCRSLDENNHWSDVTYCFERIREAA